MRKLTRFITLSCLLSAVPATAQPASGWMSDEEIRKAFAGVTINGVYVDGSSFTESYSIAGQSIIATRANR